MTLTTNQATVLGRCIVAFRDKWQLAGVMAAIDKLATDPRHPAAIWLQVVQRACDPSSATPEALLWPVEGEAKVRAFPSVSDPTCKVHGSNIVDDAGRFVCCRDEDLEPVSAPLRVGTTSGPPKEAADLIARLRAERARRVAGSTEGDKK